MVEVVATGFQAFSGLAFLPDGRILTAERPTGRLSLVDPGTGRLTTVSGVPAVFGELDAGLIEILPHPDFSRNHWLYYAYSAVDARRSTTVVERARLEGTALVGGERLFTAAPSSDSAYHYGGRLVLTRGYLFITTGERDERDQAQDLVNDNGKIIRLFEDGRVPPDNPFVGRADVRPEIWSYGHRNPQGLALDPATGDLWEDEHGPMGGDEINLIQPGRNYGWPIITYGREYNGQAVGQGISYRDGLEQPVHYYVPSIAPSGLLFYTGAAFPGWRGNLLLGAMAGRHLNRVVLDGHSVVREERLLSGRKWRVRVVAQDAAGLVYLGIDRFWLGEDQGMLVRLRPEAMPE